MLLNKHIALVFVLMFSRVGECASTIHKMYYLLARVASVPSFMFPGLEEGASAIRKMLFCLLADTGDVINSFTSGRRRLHYSQKKYCAPVPLLTFFLVGESASTSRKNYFQRAPN